MTNLKFKNDSKDTFYKHSKMRNVPGNIKFKKGAKLDNKRASQIRFIGKTNMSVNWTSYRQQIPRKSYGTND